MVLDTLALFSTLSYTHSHLPWTVENRGSVETDLKTLMHPEPIHAKMSLGINKASIYLSIYLSIPIKSQQKVKQISQFTSGGTLQVHFLVMSSAVICPHPWHLSRHNQFGWVTNLCNQSLIIPALLLWKQALLLNSGSIQSLVNCAIIANDWTSINTLQSGLLNSKLIKFITLIKPNP